MARRRSPGPARAAGAPGRTPLWAAAVLLLALTVLATGCRDPGGSPSGTASASAPAPTGTGFGAVFLGEGDCGSRGRRFTEVSCTSERAAARVLARHDGRPAHGPACPAETDFVLHISDRQVPTDEDGDGIVGQGYACMRNLEPPHPGDPGGGGGPHTVVGDCVRTAGEGQVKETACEGSGSVRPGFRIGSAVERREQCPESTDLYVRLRLGKPVGCAHRL
jgi:hypothetical protein